MIEVCLTFSSEERKTVQWKQGKEEWTLGERVKLMERYSGNRNQKENKAQGGYQDTASVEKLIKKIVK